MIELRSVSPSAINKFVECPRQWALNYDRDVRIKTSSPAADRGVLVHRALELWKDPEKAYPATLEGLELAFSEGCKLENIGESFEVYKTAKELLPKAFDMLVGHPIMPLARTKTWKVELEISNWLPSSSHPLPIYGFIDTIEIVSDPNDPKRISIVVGDYKTGRSKTKDELLEDIQSPIYMAYAAYVLRPLFEQHGFEVVSVLNVWTYIADGTYVVLSEDDYDLSLTLEYVANISRQMIHFAAEYNAKKAADATTVDTFLQKAAKLNPFCNWCAVRGNCNQIARAFEQRAQIDIFAPEMTMDTILAERDLYALAVREGEERKREIDRLVRTHMEMSGLHEIEANGNVYYEVVNRDKKVNPRALAEVFGAEFFISNGKVSQEAIRNQLNVVKITRPEMHEQIAAFIDQNTTEEPGARYLRSRKAKPKATKSRAKKS